MTEARPLLASLQPGLEATVGAWMAALGKVLGLPQRRPDRRRGAPDGFDGIERRGPYDRLLLSEWALLDVAPDEFIRRAAEREHGFYALARVQPAKGAKVHLTFDCGPSVVGAPRTAQLVVLLVMGERCNAAGAVLSWNFGDDGALQAELGAEAVARLLGQRRLDDLTRLPELSADEHWVVGGKPTGLPADHIVIRQPVDRNDLDVQIRRRGRTDRRLSLPLPSPVDQVRLLTQPFATASPPAKLPTAVVSRPTPGGAAWHPFPKGIGTPDALRFIPGTQQLCVSFSSGQTIFYSTGNLPSRSVARGKRVYPSHPGVGIGVGFQGGSVVQAALDGHRVTLWFMRRYEYTAEGAPAAGAGLAILDRDTAWVWDSAGALWLGHGGRLRRMGLASDVVRVSEGWSALLQEGNSVVAHRLAVGDLVRTRHFSDLYDARWITGTCFAARDGAGRWCMHPWISEPIPMESPSAQAHMIGADGVWDADARRSIWVPVWHDATMQQVFVRNRPLALPRQPICVSYRSGLLGIITREGTVELWDVHQRKELMLRGVAP